jgi:hypothetical protein
MKRIVWLVALACGAAAVLGAAAGQALHFPQHGFSIAPLEGRAGSTGMVVLMSLPASDGFAANVNVVAQTTHGTIDNYMALSKRQFAQAGFQVVKADKLNDSDAIFEYTGNMQGRALHWYAKASLKGDEILLATATATDPQWPKVADQLKACIDSFRRD